MWTLHTEFNKHIFSWKLNCWIQNYVIKTSAKIACRQNVHILNESTFTFTLKVIFTGRYFLLLLKYSCTVLRTALRTNSYNQPTWLPTQSYLCSVSMYNHHHSFERWHRGPSTTSPSPKMGVPYAPNIREWPYLCNGWSDPLHVWF